MLSLGVAFKKQRSGLIALLLVISTAGVLRAQDTFESLSAEADALAAINAAPQYVQTASDILTRAGRVLSGDQLRAIQDKVRNVAVTWLERTDTGATANAATAEFLVTQGLSRLGESQRADVAAAWLLHPGAVSRFSATTVSRLSEAAGSALTRAQRDALAQQGKASLGDLASVSFAQLKEHIDVRTQHLYENSEDGRVARRQIVVDWAKTREPNSLDVEAVDWAMMEMLPKWLSEYPPQEIDATWEARVTPPRSGEYTFSLSPLNLIATREEGPSRYFRLWMTVEVAGQKVLDASPEAWVHDGTAVRLQGGQAVPVKVTMQYRMAGYVPLPAAGQLFWSGPGIGKQIIGASFYQQVDSNEPGVRLSVSRADESGTRACQVIVDSIDQVLGKHAICTHEQTLGKYVDHRLDEFLSAAFMNEAVANATKENVAERVPHPFTQEPDYRGIVNKCSSELRGRIATELALRPEVLGPLDLWTMIYFHDAVRFGAERAALDLLGAWMTVHANRSPEVVASTREYFEVNCKPFRHLTIPLVIEHAESAEWFEEDYLVTESGECCLPAAAVVGYAHLVSGRMLEWIEKLDARLEDASVTGDRRVNWLIARAMAEEIRSCPQDHKHYIGCHRFGAGSGWLDEAMLVAQSPNVKERVVRERVARLAALGKLDAAEAELEGYPALSNLQAKLSVLRTAAAEQAANEIATQNAAVLAEMRRRQSRASARGDTAAADKYSAIIQQLERK